MKKEKLHKNNKTGFKTPENYFESFEASINDRLNIEDKLQGLKDPGFSVPKDYFKNLDQNILEQLQPKTKVVKLNTRKRFYYVASIAASLLLLIAIFTPKNTTSELSIAMVEDYFETQNLDSYELAQLLEDTDFLAEDFKITEANYNENNLESYLLDHADLELIID